MARSADGAWGGFDRLRERRFHGSGSRYCLCSSSPGLVTHLVDVDHEGVGFSSHNANTKAAATQATKIFQDYYPEFLARIFDSSFAYRP